MNLFDPVIDKDAIDLPRAFVVAKAGKNMYKVKDVTEKSYNVYSAKERKIGDVVRVIKGQIVNTKSGSVTKTKIVSI